MLREWNTMYNVLGHMKKPKIFSTYKYHFLKLFKMVIKNQAVQLGTMGSVTSVPHLACSFLTLTFSHLYYL